MTSRPKGGSFFGTMVLMGASLGAGCGGLAAGSDEGGGPDASGGSSGSGGASQAAGGGPSPSGGAGNASGGSTASGGVSASGGLIHVGAGGNGTVPNCAPYQLKCASSCGETPLDCSCDDQAPLSPADCAKGEVITCSDVREDVETGATTPYNCKCAVAAPSCEETCGSFDYYRCESRDFGAAGAAAFEAIVCGCAVTVLK